MVVSLVLKFDFRVRNLFGYLLVSKCWGLENFVSFFESMYLVVGRVELRFLGFCLFI